MEIWFDIWIYSTDTYIEPDADSEVALAGMPYPTVAEPNWTKVKILGLNLGKVPAAESEERNGIMVHCPTQTTKGEMVCYPLDFPDERHNLDGIVELFSKDYIYICIDGDDDTYKYPTAANWRPHSVGKCLMIGIGEIPEPEHDYENSNKKQRIVFQKYLPK